MAFQPTNVYQDVVNVCYVYFTNSKEEGFININITKESGEQLENLNTTVRLKRPQKR